LYKTKKSSKDGPKLTVKEMKKKISEKDVIGQRTHYQHYILRKNRYLNKGTVSSPYKTKVRPTITDKVDEFDQYQLDKMFTSFVKYIDTIYNCNKIRYC